MVDRVKGDGVHVPDWAEFNIMMECTPETGHCQSICTLSSVIITVADIFRMFHQSTTQVHQFQANTILVSHLLLPSLEVVHAHARGG
jgi:hypothetical protein